MDAIAAAYPEAALSLTDDERAQLEKEELDLLGPRV